MTMMTATDTIERNKRNIRRFFEDTHANRVDVVDELATPDVVTHGFPGGNPEGRDAYKQFFVGLNKAFPDMRSTIESMVADSEQVAVRFTVTGTHSAPYMGIPPQGRKVNFTGMVLYRLRDGRIAEVWLHPDNVTILQQLGVIPEAA